MKLTKSAIDGLAYRGGQDVRWDDALPGFGVRVFPSGARAFVIRYRAEGRKRYLTLGKVGVLTLEQARELARRRLVDVIEGKDPQAERRRALEGEKVRDFCAAYLERHAKPRKKSWRDDDRRIRQHIVPAWGGLRLAGIKRADVAALHRRIGERAPYDANRTLRLVSRMFGLARQWGYLDETAPNPASGIAAFPEEKRDRWIRPEELPRLAQAIDAEADPYVRAAFWLYLTTGLRRGELLAAKWADVDWTRRELRIPETKAGRVHYVPLSEEALTILQGLPRIDGNPFILPGRNPGAALVNISKPWLRVRRAAGVEDARLHDLRRTVGSWLAQSGNSLHLIGRVLNHSNQSTTAVYARFAQDHVREALEAHGRAIMGAAGKLPEAEVVPLANRR
ncbi:MAG: tyrosine-type recombinase/integrase [Candidatus Methylomirabilis sp.]|nr:tyrosine-type recombinase/integrase [Deltaproteobacteria bacterium]